MRTYKSKSHLTSALSFLALILLIAYVFYSQTPSSDLPKNEPAATWSTARALTHVKKLSQQPHYMGSDAHTTAREYIMQQLRALKLNPTVQTGVTIDAAGNVTKPVNILARIKGTAGTGKALVLMCHYDSDPHSSYGASDAASGVATILEGVRAFKSQNKKPKNDIIILITDAEEIGLNGAQLFVDSHEWAQDAGMVLNFEARGSGGPSYMLVETNGGNHNIINAFKDAGVSHPVANSLAYSIYKKLPNDTDLTVLRENGNINGLNFAFIDDHYDYHSALDTYDRLDRNTLAHQGAYLMPLLNHLSTINLDSKLMAVKGKDDIYFPMPAIKMVSYPFSWMPYLIIISGALLLFFIIYGLRKRRMQLKVIFTGFIPFLGTLILGFLITNYGWKLLGTAGFYADILQGFPYNGHWLIAAAVFITLAIGFALYHKFFDKDQVASLSVAPIFFLWLICLLIAFPVGDSGLVPVAYLPGAGFFIIPVFTGILMLGINILKRRPSYVPLVLLAIPGLFIFGPFVVAFPVALGMKILFVAAVLSALILGLLVPIIGHYSKKHVLAIASLFVGCVCLGYAFAKANFSPSQPQPTSLVYVTDLDTRTATWATYDTNLSDWTKEKLGKNPKSPDKLNDNTADSKYTSNFSYTAPAPFKVMAGMDVQIKKDTLINDLRTVQFTISSVDAINRMELFCKPDYVIKSATVNGAAAPIDAISNTAFHNRRGNRMISYYVVDNEPLELTLSFNNNQQPEFTVYATSYDLGSHADLQVSKRPNNAMPMPFVINDAIVRKQVIKLSKPVAPAPISTNAN